MPRAAMKRVSAPEGIHRKTGRNAGRNGREYTCPAQRLAWLPVI